MNSDPQDLLRLADEVAACTEPTRELADRVLLVCGWRLNHDAAEIAAWRTDPGTVEGEGGKDYPVTLAERMDWACWYKPGNRPFRDSWIDGHYRPNPLASLDAAMTLIGSDAYWRLGNDGDGPDVSAFKATVTSGDGPKLAFHDAVATTPALALCAAALRARAHSTKESDNG